jgi:predicted MFS family arabinose efflux permease
MLLKANISTLGAQVMRIPLSDSLTGSAVDGRRSTAFAVYATGLMTFMAASSAPTPLYRLYQSNWGVTPALMTVVFAVYAVSLLVALLTVGSLSDYLGRRSVILASLLLEVAAIVIFLVADDVAVLILARRVQGFATGSATGALGAGLADLNGRLAPVINSVSPVAGLGAGALGSAALVQFGPSPLRLIYVVLLAVLVLLVIATALSAPRGRRTVGALASLRPRLNVPAAARAPMLAAAPALIAVWALGGFFFSLGPSLAADVTASSSALMGGWTVCALTVTGSIAVLLLRSFSAAAVLRTGTVALAVGVAVSLAGTNSGSGWLFFAGTAIAGIGFGAGFQGAMRNVLPQAKPDQRADLLATFYVISYLATSVPAVAAGIAVPLLGIRMTATSYSTVVILLSLAALVGTLIPRKEPTAGAAVIPAGDVAAHSVPTVPHAPANGTPTSPPLPQTSQPSATP